MKIVPILLLLLFLFTACQETGELLPETETVVVEAYLFAGQAVEKVKITQAKSNSNEDTTLISLDKLQVFLSDGTDSYPLYSVGEGYYENLQLTIQSETTYSLSFEYHGKQISSDTYVPTRREVSSSTTEIAMEKIVQGTFPNINAFPDPVELEWDNTEGDYYYVVIENLEEEPEVVNEILAGDELRGRRFQFVSEPEVMDFYGIDPRREIQQFGLHQVIVFRVNPEYAALYESAGSTSTTIAQPPSNITNGLGLFTGVSSDTLYLEVQKL